MRVLPEVVTSNQFTYRNQLKAWGSYFCREKKAADTLKHINLSLQRQLPGLLGQRLFMRDHPVRVGTGTLAQAEQTEGEEIQSSNATVKHL